MPAKDPELRKKISAKAGAAVPAEKRSYYINRNLAAISGRKGGINVPAEKRTFYYDRQKARDAGKKGGLASQANTRNKRKYVYQP